MGRFFGRFSIWTAQKRQDFQPFWLPTTKVDPETCRVEWSDTVHAKKSGDHQLIHNFDSCQEFVWVKWWNFVRLIWSIFHTLQPFFTIANGFFLDFIYQLRRCGSGWKTHSLAYIHWRWAPSRLRAADKNKWQVWCVLSKVGRVCRVSHDMKYHNVSPWFFINE